MPYFRKYDLKLYVIIYDKKLRGGVIYPRAPKYRMDDEDDYIKRICCSNSIPGCIRGIDLTPTNVKYGNYYVYRLDLTGYEQVLTPRQVQVSVPDAMQTGEWWVLNPCVYSYIGKLARVKIIENPNGRDKIVYKLEEIGYGG